MLLALVFVYQIAAITASPVSQYPFDYLLDTGNEVLDSVNTERIRVSQPGGSVALRYPAFGFSDTITNVTVIGILCKNNLKAKIVEGGPGSNYVVLALLGENELPYDALVIVETAPDTDTVNVFENVKAIQSSIEDPRVEIDRNDSAEDTSDGELSNYTKYKRVSAEQQDKYSKDGNNENDVNINAIYNDDEHDTDDDPAYATPDIHRPSPDQFPDDYPSLKAGVSSSQSSPSYIQLTADDKFSNDDYDDTKGNVKYITVPNGESSHAYNDNSIQQKDYYNKYDDQKDNAEYVDNPSEIDQMFNDEEVHDKYPVNNKRNFDADDTYAVEY